MKTLEERFWEKVDVRGPNECWVWKAGFSGDYGYFGLGSSKNIGAHRFAFQWWWGTTLPSWLCVLHDCLGGDNPACCNPAHLKIGTREDNAKDRDQKGRTAKGNRSGARTHPERTPRGDRHYSRASRETYPRGGQHYTHKNPEKVARGEGHPNAKLTELQVIGIMARFLQDVPKAQIAREFGISSEAVKDIIKDRSWKHLFSEEVL